MSTAIGFVAQRGDDLELKGKQFEKIAALIGSGFFPKGIDTVQKAVAIQWMGDAVGAHPMIALQECYVVHGKVSFTWRFKLGLIQSRLPEFEWEQVSGDDKQFTLRGRRSKDHAWVQVTYTGDEARKAGRFSNPLYQNDWSSMGFKQCMHRLLDRIASDVLKGLPVPEFVEGEEIDTPTAPAKGTAEVLDDALKLDAGGSASGATSPVPQAPPSPAQPAPSSEPVSSRSASPQWKRDLYATVRRVWPGGPERGAAAGTFVLEKASLVRRQLTGFTEPLTSETLTKDIGDAVVKYLNEKYPTKAAAPPPPATLPIPPAPAGMAAPDPSTWSPPPGMGEAWEPPVAEDAPPEEVAFDEPDTVPGVSWESFMARVERARIALPPLANGTKQRIIAPSNDPAKMYLVTPPLYSALGYPSPPLVWYNGTLNVEPDMLAKMDAELAKYVTQQTGGR